MAVRGPRYDIGRIVLGDDMEPVCADYRAEIDDIGSATPVVSRVWKGCRLHGRAQRDRSHRAVHRLPLRAWERLVILAEDDANACRAVDIVAP